MISERKSTTNGMIDVSIFQMLKRGKIDRYSEKPLRKPTDLAPFTHSIVCQNSAQYSFAVLVTQFLQKTRDDNVEAVITPILFQDAVPEPHVYC